MIEFSAIGISLLGYVLLASGGGNFALETLIICPTHTHTHTHTHTARVVPLTSTRSRTLFSFHSKDADASRIAVDVNSSENIYPQVLDALRNKVASTASFQINGIPQILSIGQSAAMVTPNCVAAFSDIGSSAFLSDTSFKRRGLRLPKIEVKEDVRQLPHFSFMVDNLLGAR